MLVVQENSTSQNQKMENKAKNEGRELKDWQRDDAERLFTIFLRKKEAAKLAGERFTQETLAEIGEFSSAAMVWQYLHGHRPLNIKAARAFAAGLGVHVHDFSPSLAAEIVSASTVAKAATTTASSSRGGRTLSIEQLRLIDAISEEEARLLEDYRTATDVSRKMILSAAAGARKREIAQSIVDDQPNVRPLGAN